MWPGGGFRRRREVRRHRAATSNRPQCGLDDPFAYNGGLAASYAGFTVAASFAVIDDELGLSCMGVAVGMATCAEQRGDSFNIGVGYSDRPVGLLATYFTGEEEGLTAIPGDDENSFVEIAASYTLGPGLRMSLSALASTSMVTRLARPNARSSRRRSRARSTSTISPASAAARCQATLAPITPPPRSRSRRAMASPTVSRVASLRCGLAECFARRSRRTRPAGSIKPTPHRRLRSRRGMRRHQRATPLRTSARTTFSCARSPSGSPAGSTTCAAVFPSRSISAITLPGGGPRRHRPRAALRAVADHGPVAADEALLPLRQRFLRPGDRLQA